MIERFSDIGKWFSKSFKPLTKHHYPKEGRNYSKLLEDFRQPFDALTTLIYGIGLAVVLYIPQIFSFIGWLLTLPVAILLNPEKIWNDITSFFTEDKSPINIIGISLLNIVVTPFTWLVRIPGRLIATLFDGGDVPPAAGQYASPVGRFVAPSEGTFGHPPRARRLAATRAPAPWGDHQTPSATDGFGSQFAPPYGPGAAVPPPFDGQYDGGAASAWAPSASASASAAAPIPAAYVPTTTMYRRGGGGHGASPSPFAPMGGGDFGAPSSSPFEPAAATSGFGFGHGRHDDDEVVDGGRAHTPTCR